MENTFLISKKISIIEDSSIHREWLVEEINEDAELNVVSSDNSGAKGIDSVRTFMPTLVLLDFQLSDITGIEVAKRIKNYLPETKIFLLTSHNEPVLLQRIVSDKNIDAISVKGSYYFEQNLILAIKFVIKGGTYLEPSILTQLRNNGGVDSLNDLTKREFEVFVQSSVGKNDQQIANDLYVDLAHIRNLRSKISKKISGKKVDDFLKKLIENYQPA